MKGLNEKRGKTDNEEERCAETLSLSEQSSTLVKSASERSTGTDPY